MLYILRTSFLLFLSFLLLCSSSIAQPQRPLELNGILYEVIAGVDGAPQQAFLWSLELQELSRNYDIIETSVQRKRANILFLSETSGRDWRNYWNDRMQFVYSARPGIVNDHAEGFFSITGIFPQTFAVGDEFSLVAEPDGATRAYLNDKLVAQSLKPGHFEFWLRAWNTLPPKPETFRGNLLAGGIIPDDLIAAYLNSEPPRPVRGASGTNGQDAQGEGEQEVEMVSADDSAAINVESIASQGIIPIILSNGNETSGW